jgi:hypothetical protein
MRNVPPEMKMIPDMLSRATPLTSKAVRTIKKPRPGKHICGRPMWRRRSQNETPLAGDVGDSDELRKENVWLCQNAIDYERAFMSGVRRHDLDAKLACFAA